MELRFLIFNPGGKGLSARWRVTSHLVDLFRVLNRLWYLRGWMAGVLVAAVLAGMLAAYRVSFDPLGLERREVQNGAAVTQVLVDSPSSSLVDLERDIEPLSVRAQVFTEFLKTEPVKARIAQRAGIDPRALRVRSQTTLSSQPFASFSQPGGEQRAVDLGDEEAVASVLFRSEPESPVIQVFAQARDEQAAVALATVAAETARSTLSLFSSAAGDSEEKVIIRPLGRPEGGTINDGTSLSVAILAGMTVFIVGCLLLLFVDRGRRTLQAERAAHRPTTAADLS